MANGLDEQRAWEAAVSSPRALLAIGRGVNCRLLAVGSHWVEVVKQRNDQLDPSVKGLSGCRWEREKWMLQKGRRPVTKARTLEKGWDPEQGSGQLWQRKGAEPLGRREDP